MRDDAIDSAEVRVNNLIDATGTPGLAAAVIQGGTLKLTLEYGYADKHGEEPITASTPFRIGALTQAVTAVAVLALATRDLIDLDAPVNRYLSGLRIESTGDVTPRHLLSHTAGLGAARSLRAMLLGSPRELPETLKADASPGSKWCYSDDGFGALGQLVTDVTGVPLEAAFASLVTGPFNMRTTALERPDDLPPGHKPANSGVAPVNYAPTPLPGGLGLHATLNDLVAFAGGLLEGRYPALFTPSYRLHPRLPGMGLAFRVDEVGDHRIAWLNGSTGGFAASLFIAPNDNAAVILLANVARGDALSATARSILSDLLAVDVSPPAAGQSPTPTDASALTGYYAPSPGLLTNLPVWAAYGGGLTVKARRGDLRIAGQIDPTRTRALHPTDEPLLFTYESAGGHTHLTFAADDTGHIDRLYVGLYALYRRPYWHSLGGKLLLFSMAVLIAFLLIAALIVLTG